jgi:ERCC4-related helicase
MLAAELIGANAGWKAIFLAPTTSLVCQQTLKFAACQQIADRGSVNIRCGGLHRNEWARLLDAACVLFLTPQTLLNMFIQKAASFDQFHLLIMDECHDARGFSAMAELLRLLRALPPGAARPKVFGMTATPGAENSVVS